MTARLEFLIEVAQARDERARSCPRDIAIQHKKKAFKYRKLARECYAARENIGDGLDDSYIDAAIATLKHLYDEESLWRDERDDLRDAIDTIEEITNEN